MRDVNDISVLFVDDEVRILHAINRMLRREKYKRLFASSAKEALEIMEKEPVHVLVTDLRMPEMDGLTLIRKVKDRDPDIVCVVVTAYSQVPTLLAAINQGHVFRYITKPWNSEEDFRKIIEEAIQYHMQQSEEKNLIQRLFLQNKILANSVKKCEEKLETLNEYFVNQIEPLIKNLIQEKSPQEYESAMQKLEEFKKRF